VGAHPWHDVPLPADVAAWFPAFVEIPKGSNVKYELDKATGLLRVDRILYSAVHYSENYGFVPRTRAADGDPLDVLVLCQVPVAVGCLVRARAVGVMHMRDEKGRDEKLIAVLVDDPEYAAYRDAGELPPHRLRELEQFFRDYKMLEDKPVTVDGLAGPAEALAVLRDAADRYARGGAAGH
jgi:inorganic pyrophosphatase